MSAHSRASVIAGLSLPSQVFVHITKKSQMILGEQQESWWKVELGWCLKISSPNLSTCLFSQQPPLQNGVLKGAAFLLRSVTHWLWLEKFSMATQSRIQPAQMLSPGRESLGPCAQQWWQGKCCWWVVYEWVQKCLLDLESCWTSSGLLLDATLTLFCSTLSHSASIFGLTDLLSTVTKRLPFKSRAKGYLE